ncbi:cytochrome c oxidase accessory protein CcoG [Ancylobacter novellus DSM 506]|uniref:Cytochrome c oxidase accessory protein CcoG n=1 Tax=Ancylobacter novellus (strain ATCC 8093 / DSM 506 / JCM 20403 / CCM 1077 / IAM 12100 / NBRC 12443 / NCIMB 10456) TaxID=639283 RepID=D7A3U8_ANCN5|nr:cytochrome c oxidase accessory protein CcoG [Ancylobacter novellus]ADH91725.1 cytochrome c oxidase accessory protein CcoG [Ancylobacter novellus DSM 506]
MNVATKSENFEPDADDDLPLYEARRKIYPIAVHGTFRRIKWALLLVTLGIYYLLPFVRWDRGPNAPSQAVLVDLVNGRFYFFFIEIWPQEIYYVTGLLILAALVLFLMNAVAGRIWCGYLCPQTVWTDLFQVIERMVEGDPRQRREKLKSASRAQRAFEAAAKHFLWLMVAWWTGGAWVLYFADAPTLTMQLLKGEGPMVAYLWIGILTFTTYVLAGHMREQVCTYMCPWPRIQAALTDEYAFNVTYRYDRGEPRGSLKKTEALKLQGLPAGDCIDCRQCVAACPTGVDIRLGSQLACIQCGLCIDACDTVMEKIGRPTRLIAYDTEMNVQRRIKGLAPVTKVFRARTLLYAALIVIVGGMMVATLAMRGSEGLSAIHDRNPLFVQLSDGSIRNAYTLRIVNKQSMPRRFALSVEGVPEAQLEVVGGISEIEDGRPVVAVGPDQTFELRALVSTHAKLPAEASLPVTFKITDVAGGETSIAPDHFKGP